MACLFIPDMPLAATLRVEPELRGSPLAIIERTSRQESATIIAGQLPGLTPAQARAVKPDLIVRTLSLEGMHSTQEALLDVASSISPHVEAILAGTVYIDLHGTAALFPSERGLMTALETRAHEVGLHTLQAGIAPTRTTAFLAASHRGGGRIVRTQEMRDFLGPLPLDLLSPPEEIADRLTRWGIHTLGELARIPSSALGARLGEAGVHLARRARGEDLAPFRPTSPPTRFEESLDPGYAVGNLEALSFQMRGVLDRLTRRLRLRGLAIRELCIELDLESGQRYERSVELGAPTLEVSVLSALVRLALEKSPPADSVERIRIIALSGSVETSQLDLFLPPLPAPAELAVTLARLEAFCGPGQVGTPGCHDSHRLDEAHLKTFVMQSSKTPSPEAPPLPRPTMALRAFRPPRTVRVWERGGLPERVQIRGGPLRILNLAGPWRLFGEWWGESRFARDYFDIELADGGIYRLYRNLQNESWFVDGIYD